MQKKELLVCARTRRWVMADCCCRSRRRRAWWLDRGRTEPRPSRRCLTLSSRDVHGRFKMDRAAQTERIIRAVSNPYTTILGHMTGRQLLRRPGYDIDIEKVLAASAEHGAARKTSFRYRRFCRRADCSIAIVSTDIGSDKAGVARADILRQIRVLLHRSEDPHDKVSHKDSGSAHRNRVLVALCAIKSPGRRRSHHRRPGSGPGQCGSPVPTVPGRTLGAVGYRAV